VNVEVEVLPTYADGLVAMTGLLRRKTAIVPSDDEVRRATTSVFARCKTPVHRPSGRQSAEHANKVCRRVAAPNKWDHPIRSVCSTPSMPTATTN
jgi:hypothetical protein